MELQFSTFGLPKKGQSRRSSVSEKYPDTAVLTMYPVPDEPKAKFKFHLNTTALEALGIDFESEMEQTVAFSYDHISEGRLFIANLSGAEGKFTKVNGNGFFFNKKNLEYIYENFPNLNASEENEFKLVNVPTTQELMICELVPITQTETSDEMEEEPDYADQLNDF